MTDMKSFIENGEDLVQVLFAYKTDHAQLEQVKPGMTNKQAVYDQNLVILEPQVEKMRRLFSFYNQVVEDVGAQIQRLAGENQVNDSTLEQLSKVLDMVLRLDYVKTWQAGLNNDYSLYRRAKTDQDLSSEEPLRMFLIYPSNIIKGFRERLEKIENYHKVIAQVEKFALHKLRDKADVVYVRVAAFGIYLLEPILDNNAKFNVIKRQFKPRNLNAVFERSNNVPLHDKLSFNVTIFLKTCPKFKERASQRGCEVM